MSGGTSASAATAAGIAGLVRAANPSLSAAQVRDRLVSTSVGPHHRLDAEAAARNILPLGVSISGPSSPTPPGTYTWTAHRSGGLSPYRYAWYRDGSEQAVSLGSTYTGVVGTTGFSLRLEVTDGRDVVAQQATYIVPGYPEQLGCDQSPLATDFCTL
ncbi:S8 family serine peptidase [Longimicrobium sp.]|uniref:S8 family serine peptidase n=1 Tax=Longimicrobium sp. TaxID=2029185 RepID=UPI0039C9463D